MLYMEKKNTFDIHNYLIIKIMNKILKQVLPRERRFRSEIRMVHVIRVVHACTGAAANY